MVHIKALPGADKKYFSQALLDYINTKGRRASVVDTLVHLGADVNMRIRNCHGDYLSMLTLAIKRGSADVVAALIKHGAVAQ